MTTSPVSKYSCMLSPRPIHWLIFFSFLQILLHLPMASLPPLGQHTWRQVVGAAAARNYYEEDNRFFYPRADIRLYENDTGAIYHELPLSYWLTAQSYFVFGFNYISGRIIPLVLNLMLFFGAYFLAMGLKLSQRFSLLFSFFLGFSPLALYYVASFVPDILGLSLFTCGLAFLLSSLNKERYLPSYWLGIFFITLGILAKPTYLFFGLPVAYIIIKQYQKERDTRLLLSSLLGGFFVLAANALTIWHAKKLYDLAPLERAIHTPIGPAEQPENIAQVWQNLYPAFIKWFVEMNISHAALIFFLVGIFLVFKRKLWQSFAGSFWVMWLVSFIIYSCFFIMRFADHDYYLTSSLPLAGVVSAIGANALWSIPKWKKFAIALLILFPLLNFNRVSGRWFKDTAVPRVLLTHPEHISQHIPKNELTLIYGDSSPIIYLYYLNRKGLSLERTKMPPETLDLSAFKWLVYREKVGPLPAYLFEKFSLSEKYHEDDLKLYALTPR